MRTAISSIGAAVIFLSVLGAAVTEDRLPAPDESAVQAPAKGSKAFRALRAAYASRIEPIFRSKCFDCHSDRTDFPWYYRIPGVKYLIDRDIKKGRKLIDMSWGFPFKGLGTNSDHLSAIVEVAEDDSMPPLIYLIAHWGSGMTDEERKIIADWAKGEIRAVPGAAKKK